jgi:fibronectin type 3 domain-containing protein
MKRPDQFNFYAGPVQAALLFICLGANPGYAQPSPGQSGQFNRVNAVMTVAEAYTPQAAAGLGGAANLIVDMNNAVAGANVVMQNSGTGLWVENVGYLQTSESDPGTLHTLLSDLSSWPDVTSFWSSTGAGIIQCVGTGTDDAGLSYECGNQGTVDYEYGAWYVVYAHELGRNCCLEQGDDVGDPNPFICIMLQGYCGGANIAYCSNPSIYYNGVQLLGTTANDCGQGPLANEGNNSRQFTLNGPNYQGSKPVAFSGYNPPLTAVHCGGAAVATLAADQRTFAADQNYSGGTAWNANGYSYTVDVSGVTNPAPQTAYQDQRYGNMCYTFNNYLPGTNYLVRLHCMECCWASSGKRVFNVFINGQKVLTNFDIYATAGAQNRAVIREVAAVADANGRLVVGFSNVVDNASINAIEILQGGLFVPLNLTAAPGSSPVALSWNPVTGATGYNVKRAIWSGGPYTTVGSSASTNYSDSMVTNGTTYYYVVSAVKGGSESFNSLEASVTPVAFDPNFSFETPSVGTYQYNPIGGAWSFTAQSGANGSGIAANASAFTSANPNAPDGVQVAFLQGIATISQVISNLVTGTSNSITFFAAQRAVYVNGGQTWSLKINNVTVASFAPAATATNYVSYSATFKASSTNQTVSFAGTDLHGGDNTIFLDKVRIQTVIPPVPTGLSATPGSNQVALIWNAASGATGYNLKRSLTSGSGYVTNTSLAVTNYTDTLTTNGTMYYYVVSAVNAGGESANSVEVGARPVSVGALPLNFSVSPDGLSMKFNWPSDHTGWRLLMNTNSLANSNAWVTIPNSASTNQMWIPFDPTQNNVFFQLIYP